VKKHRFASSVLDELSSVWGNSIQLRPVVGLNSLCNTKCDKTMINTGIDSSFGHHMVEGSLSKTAKLQYNLQHNTQGRSLFKLIHITKQSFSPAIQVLDADPQAEVLSQRDDVQLLAFAAHGLHLAGAVGGHVQVQAVRQEGEEAVAVLAQVACRKKGGCGKWKWLLRYKNELN